MCGEVLYNILWHMLPDKTCAGLKKNAKADNFLVWQLLWSKQSSLVETQWVQSPSTKPQVYNHKSLQAYLFDVNNH